MRRTYFGLVKVNNPGIDAKNRQSESAGREATPAGRVTRGASAIARRAEGKGDDDDDDSGDEYDSTMV